MLGSLRMAVQSFRLFALTVAILFGWHAAAFAQAPSPVPPGMTQEQFNTMVDAIANSVAEKLKAENTPAEPATAPAAEPAAKPAAKPSSKAKAPAPTVKITKLQPSDGPDKFAVFLGQVKRVAFAVPVLGRHLAAIPGLLDEHDRGGRGSTSFLLLLFISAVLAVAAESVLQRLMAPLRRRIAVGAVPELGLRSLVNLASLAALDGLGLLLVWVITRGAVGAWFSDPIDQNKLAAAVLAGIFSWRLYVFIFRVVLRPGLPNARLCVVDDRPARMMYLRISILMLAVILGRMLFLVLFAIQTPPEALSAFQVFNTAAFVALFVWLVVASRDAARQWLGDLGQTAPLAGVIGRHWTGVAITFIVALGLTSLHGTISGQLHISQAMLLTFILVVAVLLFETFLLALVRRFDSQLAGFTPASNMPKLPDVVARCLRVAVLIAVIATIAERWVVEVFRLANENEWEQLTRSSRTAAITLFLAYVAWELFNYWTAPYRDAKKAGGPAAAGGDGGAPPTFSRLSTLMPLLRVTVAIVICLLAVLISLDDFGVNIAPLIAGASVFGLAISFGSQTLVKDIVSGIFYLSDDAFRVGEYIDCGKAKGTVEGFTLRSLKLRHQNGPIHTIPFGQLGQITNYSRDWTTIKFNLRFARDTNLETLRKAAKKIGTEIQEMPEYKDDIIEPFKMQGVADVLDNAFVVRFKFTAKPGNPTLIQKEAMKRMFVVFAELGIEFAKEGAAVVVHAAPPPPPVDQTPAAGSQASSGQPATLVAAQ